MGCACDVCTAHDKTSKWLKGAGHAEPHEEESAFTVAVPMGKKSPVTFTTAEPIEMEKNCTVEEVVVVPRPEKPVVVIVNAVFIKLLTF